MLTAPKNSATSATTTWIQPTKLTMLSTVNSPAMNRAYTPAVTVMKISPMISTFLARAGVQGERQQDGEHPQRAGVEAVHEGDQRRC